MSVVYIKPKVWDYIDLLDMFLEYKDIELVTSSKFFSCALKIPGTKVEFGYDLKGKDLKAFYIEDPAKRIEYFNSMSVLLHEKFDIPREALEEDAYFKWRMYEQE